MTRRWIFYLALNVLVSAATMLGVLYLWNRSHQAAPITMGTPTAQQPHGDLPLPPSVSSTHPTATPMMYTVRPGDTLGQIADEFGVDIEELIILNNLTNPDVTPQEGEDVPWPEIDSVISPGNLFLEAVKIVNPGSTAVLTGWRLKAPSGAEYVFDEFSLVAQGAVLVHTAEGIDTSIDRYWNLKDVLWHSGDEVLLLDSLGNLRSTYVVP
jgi:hypothetical protein